MGIVNTTQLRATPYWLNFLFAGQLFNWWNKFSIGATTTVYAMFVTSSSGRIKHSLGMTVAAEAGGAYTVQIIEAPTVSTNGTLKAAVNMDRLSAKTADTIFYINPTGVSGGTVIDEFFIPTGSGPNSSGSLVVGTTERVLKKNTIYVISIANAGNNPGVLEITNLFYESGN